MTTPTQLNSLLEANTWKYMIMKSANKRVFAAILSAYYLTIPDVTAQSIGLILLIANIASFIFEIPSGYMADKLGHKETLVLSRVLLLLSTILYLVSNSLTLLIIASVFFSLAHAFMSGTASAFMHDTLLYLKKDDQYTKIMGKINSVGFGVPIILAVLVPFLVDISFKAPFVVALFIDVIGLLAVLSLVKPPVSKAQVEEVNAKNFAQVIKEGRKLKFFRFALFSAIIGGFLFGLGIFRAPYQVFLEIPVIYFGILFGLGRGLASLLLYFSGAFKELFTIFSFYRFQIILNGAIFLSLGFVSQPLFVVMLFIFANGFQWGLSTISSGFMLDIIKKSKFKATLLSVKSQIGLIFSGAITFGLGVAIDSVGYKLSYLTLGLLFILLSSLAYLYARRVSV